MFGCAWKERRVASEQGLDPFRLAGGECRDPRGPAAAAVGAGEPREDGVVREPDEILVGTRGR